MTSQSDIATSILVYGTPEQPPTPLRLAAGPLLVEITDGAISSIAWDGVEVICGIDYPVRDADWGTALVRDRTESHETVGQGWHYRSTFAAGDFRGAFSCETDGTGELRLNIRLVAQQPATVCRAGFVVLHPLQAAGAPLRVTHPDGTIEATAFPRLISPSQPAMNITGLAWTVQGVAASMRFAGDIFEMEDQRNWTDASFKTFCRPLLLPYPFEVAAGETIEQSITLRLSGHGAGLAAVDTATRLHIGERDGSRVPEFGLALDPAWPLAGPDTGLDRVPRWLLRVDAAEAADLAWLAACTTQLQGAPFDLEVLVDGEPSALDRQLRAVAQALAESALTPEHLFALPRAYLRCIQTWEPAPPGARPADAVAAARRHFPRSRIGAGMLTNFTELNRCPPAGEFDYVTHSVTPLVHAADDRSVMRTLDTLQPIFDTLHEHAAGRPWRLGLASIGMRSNPYGRSVADNPGRVRLAMAQHDPRQAGLFGAAWMIGAAAATAGRPIEHIALGAPYGPFGLVVETDDGTGDAVRPVCHAFAALAQLSGHPRLRLELPAGLRGVAADTPNGPRAVIANCTAAAVEFDPGPEMPVAALDAATAAMADRHWLAHAPRSTGPVRLGPFGIAVVGREAGA